MEPDSFSILPLSSSLANSLPSNPLLSPILSRIAYCEALLLLTPLGRVLEKFGLGQKRILFLSFFTGLFSLIKIRHQWRSLMILAGLTEGIIRGVRLLNEIEIGSLEHDSESKRKKIAEELKHLLSFWTLVGIIEITQRIVIKPIPKPIQKTLLSFLTNPRFKLWRKALDRNFFEITKNLPLPATLRPAARPSRNYRPFPAPSPLIPSRSTIQITDRITFLPAKFFSEIQFSTIKMIVLWIGLRRDGFGASMIWNWLLNPFFIVMRKRRMTRLMNGQEDKRKKVIKVIVVDDDSEEEEEEGYLKVRDRKVLQAPTPGGYTLHDDSTTLSNSPEPKFSLPPVLQEEIDQDQSFDRSFNSELPSPSPPTLKTKTSSLKATTTQRFPTPNGVTYRLTSSSFPIHARHPSGNKGSGSDLTTDSLSKLDNISTHGISPMKKYLDGLAGGEKKARSEGILSANGEESRGEESRAWADV